MNITNHHHDKFLFSFFSLELDDDDEEDDEEEEEEEGFVFPTPNLGNPLLSDSNNTQA